MTVSIGEGVKNQVIGQINGLGNNIITIKPGNQASGTDFLKGLSFNGSTGTSTLTETDIANVKALPGVVAVSPNANITAAVSSADITDYAGAVVVGTTIDTQQVLNQTVEFGEFLAKGIQPKM